MRLFIFPAFILFVAFTADKCGTRTKETSEYKGKLEIKALCMNYTVRVLEGNMDTSLINSTWTDESSGKTYSNVFGLGSRCNFPSTINEGDEFYFTIDTVTVQNCAVCMAYYPSPPKKLSIKVNGK